VLSGVGFVPESVLTGKVDIKGNVGPVGGLSWRGTGKILAAVRTRKVRIRRFVLPKWNYESAPDEMRILEEKMDRSLWVGLWVYRDFSEASVSHLAHRAHKPHLFFLVLSRDTGQ